MVINGGSPIIQNTFGGVSFNGTPSQISPEELEAAQIADLTGGLHYDYNPASRLNDNFMNPPMMGQGIGVVYQAPTFQQGGLGGYPANGFPPQPMMQQPQYGWQYYNGQQPQQQNQSRVAFGPLGGYNQGNYPQYGNYNRQRYAFGDIGYTTPNAICRDQTYIEPGFNPYGSMMFASTDADRLNDIIDRQAQEQDDYRARMGQMYNGINYNYYGNFNYGYNSYIAAKYQHEERMIIDEAKQRQLEFNKKLSRVAHTYLDDDIDDDYIDSIYDDREITVPGTDISNLQMIQRLNTFTVDYREVTKAQYYAANNAISEEYRKVISDDNCDSLTSFLDKAGELYALGMQYEVDRQMRDMSGLYERDNFMSVFRKSKTEHRRPQTLFPNLMENGRILADGTLEIKAPDWIARGNSSNETEASYRENRQMFIDRIYNKKCYWKEQ